MNKPIKNQLANSPSYTSELFNILQNPISDSDFKDYIKQCTKVDRDRLFRRAVFNGNIHILDQFLSLSGSNSIGVNGRLADGCTPLQWAAEMGLVDMTRYLLQRGADPYNRFGINLSAYELAKEGPTRELMDQFIEAESTPVQEFTIPIKQKEQRG